MSYPVWAEGLVNIYIYNNICKHYSVTVRNKFDSLQETSERLAPNDKCENFVTAHLEAAAEYIPTKPKPKNWVLWESEAVLEKQINLIKASLLKRRNPTNTNVQKLKRTLKELWNTEKNN